MRLWVWLALLLLAGCASTPERVCRTLECGTVCCNDDGAPCLPCPRGDP
jgi:hypothetical protein